MISSDRNADNHQRTTTNSDEHHPPWEATRGRLRNTHERGSSYPPFDTIQLTACHLHREMNKPNLERAIAVCMVATDHATGVIGAAS